MRRLVIGDRIIDEEHPAFIIAEAGINHQGEVGYAKQLIDIAVAAQADAVKFQRRNIHKVFTRELLEAPYHKYYSFGDTYEEHRRKLELSDEEYFELKKHSDENRIIFFASAWDEDSVDFLERLGVPAHKIASADLTNIPLVEKIAATMKPVILSTGMSTMDEIKAAVHTIEKHHKQIAILQCTSTYPSKYPDINLNVIKTYLEQFPDYVIGYSGHELGIAVPVAARAMGALIIERHFTIDRAMQGADHAASLEPTGMTKLVRDIRNIETSLGSSEKEIQASEVPIRKKLAKSVSSLIEIPHGTVITRDMIANMSPATGIPANEIENVVGKKTAKEIRAGVTIMKEDIEW